MLNSPKHGNIVIFRPPENAYSPNCLEQQFAGQTGILEGYNETRARIRFKVNGESHRVSVNVCYVYDV